MFLNWLWQWKVAVLADPAVEQLKKDVQAYSSKVFRVLDTGSFLFKKMLFSQFPMPGRVGEKAY